MALSDKKSIPSMEILKGILDNLPIGYFHIDEDGVFRNVYGSVLSRMGITRDYLIGKNLGDVFPTYIPYLEKALAGETVSVESEGESPNGPWYFQNYVFPAPDKRGCLGFILDITDKKLAELEKARLEVQIQNKKNVASLGILAGGLAHDFNNLMMGVLGNVSIINQKFSLTPDLKLHLDQIKTASEHAREICKSMLDFAGQRKPRFEPVDVNQLIHEVISCIDATVDKSTAFRIHTSPRPLFARGNRTQLRQVLLNLVKNAVDAIGKNEGEIRIESSVTSFDETQLMNGILRPPEMPEGAICITVSDNGSGMDNETINKIFDPFYSTKFTGRGLGLASVIGILQAHKGDIQVRSIKGKGTEFSVLIPASTKIPPASPRQKDSLHDNDSRLDQYQNILVIDDDPISQSVITTMLETMGLKVVIASNGSEGIDAFRKDKDRLDAVVLDMTMPDQSGAQVLVQLKKYNQKVPVIISSAYSKEEIQHDFESPPDEFIQKPYDLAMLTRVLTRVARNECESCL